MQPHPKGGGKTKTGQRQEMRTTYAYGPNPCEEVVSDGALPPAPRFCATAAVFVHSGWSHHFSTWDQTRWYALAARSFPSGQRSQLCPWRGVVLSDLPPNDSRGGVLRGTAWHHARQALREHSYHISSVQSPSGCQVLLVHSGRGECSRADVRCEL